MHFLSHRLNKAFLRTFSLLVAAVFFLLLTGCKQEMDYTPYISELRSNILLAEEEGFQLRIYAVKKEIPYLADGIPRECNTRLEAYLHAPDGSKTCHLRFTLDSQEIQREMSFDNVKAEYFFSCSLDVSETTSLPCVIEYGDRILQLNATTVRTESILTANNVLSILQTEESELFSTMTDKYGFSGEIYVRLIYENAPYYYVGIIQRDGVVHAFLINAQSGKILAKRTM